MSKLCLLMLMLFAGVSAAGQTTQNSGLVKGIVVDEAGAIISDVRVTLEDRNSKEFKTVTNEKGEFELSLPEGSYSLTAEYTRHDGWKKFYQKMFIVVAERTNLVRITLTVNPNGGSGGSDIVGELVGFQGSGLGGTVRTYQDAVIPSTQITAKNEKGQRLTTLTDREGHFEIKLVPGTYEIEFVREGFKRTIVTNVVFDPIKSAPLIVKMEPGQCNDCNGEMLGQERWDYYGILTGTIYDPQGAVIPNAKITIQGEDGIDRVVKSNREGLYESRIRKGENRISIEAKNFETVVFEKYRAARSYKGKMYLDIVMIDTLLKDKEN